jgi:hypothetical protein
MLKNKIMIATKHAFKNKNKYYVTGGDIRGRLIDDPLVPMKKALNAFSINPIHAHKKVPCYRTKSPFFQASRCRWADAIEPK